MNKKRETCDIEGCFSLQRNRGHMVWGKYCDKHHKARPLKEIEWERREKKHKTARRLRIKLAANTLVRRAKAKRRWSLPRTCKDCGKIKPASSYSPQGNTCLACKRLLCAKQAKVTNLKKNYNLTVADYGVMLVSQNGVCAICGNPPSDRGLAVDHCHATNKVRGLLCFTCNVALGCLRDDLDLLASASSYLINSRLKVVG